MSAEAKSSTVFACKAYYAARATGGGGKPAWMNKKRKEGAFEGVPKQFKCASMEEDIDRLVEQVRALHKSKKHRVRIIIDTREHNQDIADVFARVDRDGSLGLVSTAQLRTGDFVLLVDELWAFTFERKTLGDECGSKRDNRGSKQTANMGLLLEDVRADYTKRTRVIQLYEKMDHRLVGTSDTRGNDCLPPDDCYVFFGGDQDYDGQALTRKALIGGMVNKIVRDNFRIVISESPIHTAFWLLEFMLKCHEYGKEMGLLMAGQRPFVADDMEVAHEKLDATQQATYMETRDLPTTQAEPQLKQVPPEHLIFFQELMLHKRLTIGYAYAIYHLFPGTRAFARYLEQHADRPQVVVKQLACLSSQDPRPDHNSKKKLGPQVALRLFNHYHGTRWVMKGTKVVERPADYVEADDEEEEATYDDADDNICLSALVKKPKLNNKAATTTATTPVTDLMPPVVGAAFNAQDFS